MVAVILAAGYKLNHKPHIPNMPIPLMKIGGLPIIDHIITKIEGDDRIEKIVVVTNAAYRKLFDKWHNYLVMKIPHLKNRIEIISAPFRPLSNKQSAFSDIWFTIQNEQLNEKDLLIIAGDNFFNFEISKLIDEFEKERLPQVALCELKEAGQLAGKFGVVKCDNNNQITSFEEKPEEPRSTLASTLCYIFTPNEIVQLERYLSEVNEPRYAGEFIAWLVNKNYSIYGYIFNSNWFDLGDYPSYRALNQTELKKRFDTIGRDPFYESISAIVLFADIIGAATISEYSTEEDYDDFICQFQERVLMVIENNLCCYTPEDINFCEYSVHGDEAVLIMYTKDSERDVKTAISIAIELKRECFLADFNQNRQGKPFYDVRIGIHYGNVMLKRHPSIKGTDRSFNAEGYSINLAKRIEGCSRKGRFSKIILSQPLRDFALFLPLVLSERIDIELKGIHGSYPIYELQAYGDIENPEEIDRIELSDLDYYVAALESSRYDMWLLFAVARFYYDQEDFSSAQKLYREAISNFPDFVPGHLYLGKSLYREGNFAEAKQYLETAVLLAKPFSPILQRALNFLANTLRRLGNYSEACQLHQKAILASSESAYVYNAFAYTIAEAYSAEFNLESALDLGLQYLNKAESLFQGENSFDYLTEHTKGMIFLKMKSFAESIQCFTRAIEDITHHHPDMMPFKKETKTLEICYHLAVALFEQGRPQWLEASKLFKQCVDAPEMISRQALPYYWFESANSHIKIITATYH